jgi:hypothetical protein
MDVIFLPVPAFAWSKACVWRRSFGRIAGSILGGCTDICLFWFLRLFIQRPLGRTDPSSRGIPLSVFVTQCVQMKRTHWMYKRCKTYYKLSSLHIKTCLYITMFSSLGGRFLLIVIVTRKWNNFWGSASVHGTYGDHCAVIFRVQMCMVHMVTTVQLYLDCKCAWYIWWPLCSYI